MQELNPVYTTSEINESIILYDGELELEQNGQTFSGEGTITFKWLPFPGTAITFRSETGSTEFNIQEEYFINASRASISIQVLRQSAPYHSVSLSGSEISFLGDAHIGSGKNLSYVVFHIVNFHEYLFGMPCKVELESWRLTFRSLNTSENHTQRLKATGGFAITHIGRLERSDRSVFNAQESLSFLDTCADALSFARGLSIPIVLPVGYDSENNKIWEFWKPCRHGSSWKNVSTWFPIIENEPLDIDENGLPPIDENGFPIFRCRPYEFSLPKLLTGFVRWKQKWEIAPNLGNTNIVLNTYLEANLISTVEVKLILIQAALELSASVHLTNVEKCFEESVFKKKKASEKIRTLLICLKIPTIIPVSDLPELYSYANTRNPPWDDALHALTEVRNDFSHAKKKYPDLTIETKEELCRLGLHYLELVLLALMDYDGGYINRCFMHHESWKPIHVPWLNKT
jgi:hypothetical protein